MAYTALYRKWRPASFSDVKGQEAIVTTLKNQLKSGRIGHAYLFCGTRGTGKTTVAKIFARAVNCETPKDGDPCGECPACRAIESGAAMNVIEIDAASNNGVDNIREIRDEVQYSPADGKYRVYIIDEVHMLSPGAFNALLKTLEEPPSYVIFILATTEPHKIPVTVLSRCQRYDFKRMTVAVLMERLQELCSREQVDAEEKALRYIARKADGAMRDAISLLDQCIAFHIGEKLTYEKVLAVLGAVDRERFSRFFLSIQEEDITGLLEQIDQLVMDGRELAQFVQDFIWYLRSLLLLISSSVGNELLDLTEEDWENMSREAEMTTAGSLMRLIRIFSELYNQMRGAVNKRVLLEIAVIRIAEPEMEDNLESVQERIRRLEAKIAAGIPVQQVPVPVQAVPVEDTKEEPEVIRLPEAEYEDLMEAIGHWDELVVRVVSIDYLAGRSLRGTRPRAKEDGGMQVVFHDATAYRMAGAAHAMKTMEDVLAEHLGKSLSLEPHLEKEKKPEPVYERITDEDLEAFHMDVDEINDLEEEE